MDKPILLGISAVWCHWCHVMDKTTYSVSEIARLIEEKFVPIRVNRDQRPDIDRRYNMGGWPSTVFLTPDGEVLMGGTYIPPQQMIVMLEHVSLLYEKTKETLKSRIKELPKKLKQQNIQQVVDSEGFQSILDTLMSTIASRFDSVYAGFGDAPKFPHSGALRLTLLHYHLQGHTAALNIVKKTLRAMQSGGIYDAEEGGFFRYSTTRDWSVPHYEKMCEDNAKLLLTYLEVYQATGEAEFRETAKGILNYIDTKLSDQENGGFFGSQDADEVYYKLKLSERKTKTPPRIDQTLFVNWNAMMVSSYLLASVVLHESEYQKFAFKTVNRILDLAFSSKDGMKHYIVADKSYVSGLLTDQVFMIKCLLDCYQTSSEKKYLKTAESLAGFVLDKMWDKNGGFFDRIEDAEAFGALKLADKPLEESSVAVDAFLRLYHLTGKQNYIDAAKRTLEFFVNNYQQYGIMGAIYGMAIQLYLSPVKMHIIGSREDDVSNQFLKECLKIYTPLKIVEVIDPKQDKGRLNILGYPESKQPTLYICSMGECNSTEDPIRIAELLGDKKYGNQN